MKNNVTLTITSLLGAILFALHWADEISRGMEPATTAGLFGIVILVVWFYGTLALSGRRLGYIVMLVGGLFGLGVLVLHMQGAGYIGRRITNTGAIFFWTLTLISLGVTGTLSMILAAQKLWSTRGRARVEE
jgi:hypothetical protein